MVPVEGDELFVPSREGVSEECRVPLASFLRLNEEVVLPLRKPDGARDVA